MNLFLFRRDFRLHDNTGFLRCVTDCIQNNIILLPIFIYNKKQVLHKQNRYFSNNSMQFLVESLRDLEKDILEMGGKLYKFVVDDVDAEIELIDCLNHCCKIHGIYMNMDVTPFAVHRDNLIRDGCKKLDIIVNAFEDYTLLTLNDNIALTKNGQAYQIFGPFYRKHELLHERIRVPVYAKLLLLRQLKFYTDVHEKRLEFHSSSNRFSSAPDDSTFFIPNKNIAVTGGRSIAITILDGISKGKYKEHHITRDIISQDDGTTRLSAYLKYGCISVREFYFQVYNAYGLNHSLIRELFFREFYYRVLWHLGKNTLAYMTSKTKNKPFTGIELEWATSKYAITGFSLWTRGETGTPLVDAGMRQLNKTGYMHNRCRMVTAMYLVKLLHVDWRKGEEYFATKLVDYDPCQNSAGWQWVASVGTDAVPYFRIMNPYTQQKKFDKDAIYVKKWIPELHHVSPRDISMWENKSVREKYKHICDYPAPYVPSYKAAADKAKEMYKYAKS